MQAFDGPIYIADAALYLMKKKPELGIKDPYELNEAQYKAALDLLRGQRKLVGKLLARRLRADRRLHQRGRGRLGLVAVPGQRPEAKKQPIATVGAGEGATGWADTTMMHAEAKNPNCAYLWLEQSLNPKLQGDLAAWFGSVPAVPAACKGNELLERRGLQAPGLNASTRSTSGGRRRRSARRRRPVRAVPQVGRRTTSRSWAAAERRRREQRARCPPLDFHR